MMVVMMRPPAPNNVFSMIMQSPCNLREGVEWHVAGTVDQDGPRGTGKW